MYNVIMKLKIYKTDDKYAFSIDGFSSLDHACFYPDVNPSYKFAWQAMEKAKSYAKKRQVSALEDLSKPVRSNEPAEDALLNHYKQMLVEMSKKVEGIDDDPAEDKKMTYLIIKSQVEDLLRIKDGIEEDRYKIEVDKIINEYRLIVQDHFRDYLAKDKMEADAVEDAPSVPNMPMPPEEGQPQATNMTMASKKKIELTEEELMDLLDHYGGRVCSAIAQRHPDAIYKVNIREGSFDIICLDRKSPEPLIKITINEGFNINNIVPMGGLSETCPSFSPKFYQRYWKPIVESLGHFFLDDLDSMIIPEMGALPDMADEDKECSIRGWNPRELKEVPLSMSFKEESPMWMISAAKPRMKKEAAEYTEEDFLRTQPTRVRCIDQKLELFGNIGEVVEIIPINAGVGFELDINFGRKIVRLSKNQVEIVNDL